MKWEVRI